MLTEKRIERLRPDPEKGYYLVWDTGGTPGFAVRVTRAGAKSYVVQYRIGKHERRSTICRVGELSLKAARAKAGSYRSTAREGNDPTRKAVAKRVGATVVDLWKIYQAVHLPKKRARSQAEDRTLWALAKPHIGRLLVKDVEAKDVVAMHKAVRDEIARRHRMHGKAGKERPACVVNEPGTIRANRCLSLVSMMFKLAEHPDYGLRTQYSNPCYGLERFPEEGRDRVLTDDEIAAIFKTLDEMEAEGWRPEIVSYIRLVALTGFRRAEPLKLRWSQVNLETGTIRVLYTKQGKSKVETYQLNSHAVAVLKAIKREPDEPFVFPSPAPEKGRRKPGEKPAEHKPVSDVGRKFREVARRAKVPDDITLHVWRHTFISFGGRLHLSLDNVGKMVGHRNIATTEKYRTHYEDVIRDGSEAIGAKVVGIATTRKKAS